MPKAIELSDSAKESVRKLQETLKSIRVKISTGEDKPEGRVTKDVELSDAAKDSVRKLQETLKSIRVEIPTGEHKSKGRE